MFPYDYLAEFSVVARTGSLSRAALELSLSHSSLSRHIRTLETILGVTLVTRTSEGVELTEDGRYVANRANDIVNIAEDLTYHMSKLRNVGRMPVYGLASLGTLRAQFESTAHALRTPRSPACACGRKICTVCSARCAICPAASRARRASLWTSTTAGCSTASTRVAFTASC